MYPDDAAEALAVSVLMASLPAVENKVLPDEDFVLVGAILLDELVVPVDNALLARPAGLVVASALLAAVSLVNTLLVADALSDVLM